MIAATLAMSLALAAAPSGDLGAQATGAAGPGGAAGGLGLSSELLVLPSVTAGVRGDLLYGTEGLSEALRFSAGWYLRRPWMGEVSMAALAGLGLRWVEAPRPGLWGGARVDLPLADRLALRFEAGLQADPGRGLDSAWLSVGPVRLFRPAPPAPRTSDGGAGRHFDPADARVWLPHPICAWYPVLDALALVGDLPDETPAEVHAQGYLPAPVPLGALPALKMRRAPAQGGLLVVGAPGDRVWVGGVEVAVSGNGVALVNAPPGPVTVRVQGGGREDLLYGAVGDGYATWLRGTSPQALQIPFPAGDANLDEGSRAAAAAAAALAGGWRFSLQGSASPEGDEVTNLRLAERRAVAVMRAMLAAGLSRDQILLQAPRVSERGDALDQGRYVLITPVPAPVTR